uniref:Caspase family p20 domain-containing protein n=1 Tax=Leptobrachium leishanense TaxID=445787 RepID=A0A8C5LK44_9ANUR
MSDPAESLEDTTDAKIWNIFKYKSNKVDGPSPVIDHQESRCILRYEMGFPQMGLCLIIDVNNGDNACFSQTGMREDVKTAKDTFEFLGFLVTITNVKTYSAAKSILSKAAQSDHSQSSSFVCVVLIQEADATSNLYESRDITEEFTGDKCKTLLGKPKLFFVLGTKEEDESSLIETDSVSSDGGKITKIPKQADFLYVSFIASGFITFKKSFNMPRKCLNHPDNFCYMRGEETFKSQRRNFTTLVKNKKREVL